MAIVTAPSNPKPQSIIFAPMSSVAVSRSPFSFAQQVQAHSGQFWTMSLVLPPMKREVAAAWQAFMLQLNGPENTFLYGDPLATKLLGAGKLDSPLVKGASQTGSSLITDAWTISTTNIVKAGDMFSLGAGTSTRLHMITANGDSDSSGDCTLSIWPSLRSSPADDSTLTIVEPKGHFRLASNEMRWEMNNESFYGMSLAAEEAL